MPTKRELIAEFVAEARDLVAEGEFTGKANIVRSIRRLCDAMEADAPPDVHACDNPQDSWTGPPAFRTGVENLRDKIWNILFGRFSGVKNSEKQFLGATHDIATLIDRELARETERCAAKVEEWEKVFAPTYAISGELKYLAAAIRNPAKP